MNLTLTPQAAERLRAIIQNKGEPLSLRILVRPGGCRGLEYGMALERTEKPDDVKIRMDDLTILVDPASAPLLDGAEIDYRDSLMGGGFTIQNPNATYTCGCGRSFRAPGVAGRPAACSSGCSA